MLLQIFYPLSQRIWRKRTVREPCTQNNFPLTSLDVLESLQEMSTYDNSHHADPGELSLHQKRHPQSSPRALLPQFPPNASA